jgi:hypothetical protein
VVVVELPQETPMLISLLFLVACTSPEQRCEDALDSLNACLASAGSASAVNTSVCDDFSADDAECLEEAADDAVCTTTEGVQTLVLKLCSCNPSACLGGGTDTGTYTNDTGYSTSYR